MRPTRIEPSEGQESVWDYPRPPRIDPTSDRVVVAHGDLIIADTTSALRVLETSQPPAFYIPVADIDMAHLPHSHGRSFCEWKGEAAYVDFRLDDLVIPQVGWTYPTPTTAFSQLADHWAFYAQKLNCSVDGEQVIPNEGSFYGGWVTSKVVGPFKGGAGSSFW